MTDHPRRPTLHLKNRPPPAPAPAPAVRWKCKPCGQPFEVGRDLAVDAVVRCPACGARLGRAGQFWPETAQGQGVRARMA